MSRARRSVSSQGINGLSTAPASTITKPCILIVEDDDDVRDLIVSILDADAAEGRPAIDGYVVKTFRPSAIDKMVANLLADTGSSEDEQT